ncbi:hypothetical protein BH20ACT2_BH20ACT2_08710 [soil metagenome]
MFTEQQRHDLYVWLEQAMGDERAATLMGNLPPVGWADVATKGDLDHLETVFRLELQGLDDRFEARLHRQINRVLVTFVAAIVALAAAQAGMAMVLVRLA